MWGNLSKICVNLCKIAVCALILQKWHPNWKWRCFFHGKSCFNLVVFGQVRRSLGKLGWNLGKKGAWSALIWKMRQVKCCCFLEVFFFGFKSGKFAEIWAIFLRTTQNLSAPTPLWVSIQIQIPIEFFTNLKVCSKCKDWIRKIVKSVKLEILLTNEVLPTLCNRTMTLKPYLQASK